MSKINRLTKYLAHIQERLDAETPPKHKINEKTFRRYLRNEKADTEKKIQNLRLEGKGGK